MAGVPTQTGSVPLTLDEGLALIRNISTQVKYAVVNQLLPGAQTTGLSAQAFLGIPQAWTNWAASLSQAAALPGMTAFAQTELGITYDIVPAVSALVTAMAAVVTAITSSLFSTSTSAGQYANLSASGLTYATFTPTQLAGLVPLLQALQAALD